MKATVTEVRKCQKLASASLLDFGTTKFFCTMLITSLLKEQKRHGNQSSSYDGFAEKTELIVIMITGKRIGFCGTCAFTVFC